MDVSILKGLASEGYLLGSSIADDVAHDTKKGSIAKVQEGINSKGHTFDVYIHIYMYIYIYILFHLMQERQIW